MIMVEQVARHRGSIGQVYTGRRGFKCAPDNEHEYGWLQINEKYRVPVVSTRCSHSMCVWTIEVIRQLDYVNIIYVLESVVPKAGMKIRVLKAMEILW